MLQSVEVLPGTRRSLRRAVHFNCDVVAEAWDEAVPHVATDLSLHGLWLPTAFPLPIGTEVAVSFTPPRWRRSREVYAFARVRRAIAGRTGEASGMGLELIDLRSRERAELELALRGLPPPLRRGGRRTRHELVWIDRLLTWEEDLGDRINTFEVSEAFERLGDHEIALEAIGELLAS
jgi:hypothetical protein